MVELLARNWGLVALRGVFALVFGLLTLFRPGVSLIALMLLFGFYALVDGVTSVATALAHRREEPLWGALLFGGVAGIVIGGITLFMPGNTAIILLYFIAAWAILLGVAEIVAAVRLRKVLRREWLLGLAGALAVAFGFLMMLYPGAGALAMVLYIGAYAAVVGVLLIALGFELRSWGRAHAVTPAAM
ncbi:MAG TPA: HdeD family acid-resistance protein [Gemmatimonadales bacterium]|nr:HdeD family acid-resistance protein [Gemmatimonadales bacterium]